MTPPVDRSLPNRLWQAFLKFVCRLGSAAIFKIRVYDRQRVPDSGGGLVLANHQSNMDPVLIGLSCERRLNYVARTTLFDSPLFRLMVWALDAIPIDRDGGGLGGLKETLKRIKRGEMVLLFPEGTRTPDGEVHTMKPGFCAIARRAAVPLVPVALDGASTPGPGSARCRAPAWSTSAGANPSGLHKSKPSTTTRWSPKSNAVFESAMPWHAKAATAPLRLTPLPPWERTASVSEPGEGERNR